MTILIDSNIPVLVQGITGRIGQYHCKQMLENQTNIVAGVTPGKAGDLVDDIPVFDTVKQAVAATGAQASIIFVPPPFAADSILEAADGGIRLAVSITDGIPAQDMIRVKRYMRRYKKSDRMQLLGPNCSGVISPGKAMLGIMPANIFNEGQVGIITRSGTLGYEAAAQMQQLNIGVSSSVGIGGDPINGSSFIDILKLFETDHDTEVVVMVGEIGGPQEAEAAHYIRDHFSKPVVAYIAGSGSPLNRSMGHAGAIISAFGDSADEKMVILRDCGVTIVEKPSDIGSTVAQILNKLNTN